MSAISLPVADFATCLHLLPRDRSALIVVYGDNGNDRETAVRWAQSAAAAGYTNVAIYDEGFRRWKERHMPVAPLRTDS